MNGLYIDFALGFNLPPYWRNHPVKIERISDDVTQTEAKGKLYQDSLSIRWEEEGDKNWWELPLDSVISISGKNTLIRRNVLKVNNTDSDRRGTIKELWSQDDYEIQIAGIFKRDDGQFPETEIAKIRKYVEGRKTLMVKSNLFTLFNITKIAIEDYSIPFTKGIENQMYNIKAYSDDMHDLLIKE
jgi:hypothetical protein